ncbi:DUF1648 domain-containing protein [Gordonia terrae]|uniref:DUF1648 domain-containing protein n=1 Tax=Gordonia terrae TaxID=2055 RepID=UPI00200AD3EA|nr:DUF1648 domain-containing protein [Gordonia terrae]UPW07736.1 DUF1648 domain-containing protein [Gordonia terrae]
MTDSPWSAQRWAFVLATAVFASVWVAVAVAGPARIAGHIDAAGEVTRWDSKWVVLTGLGAVGLLIVVVFGASGPLLARLPARAINLPGRHRKEYWMRPEHRAEFNRLMAGDLELIGAATMALLAWLLAATTVFSASGQASMNAWAFAVPLVVYVLALIGYTVYIAVGDRYRVRE